MKEYCTTKEASKILKRDPFTIRQWIKTGKLTAHKVGGFWMIKRSDLEKYFERRRIDLEDMR